MRRLLTLSMAAVLTLSMTAVARGAQPPGLGERDAANVGRARAAEILGRTPGQVHPLAYGDPVTSVGGKPYWTGVFRGAAEQ